LLVMLGVSLEEDAMPATGHMEIVLL